MSEQLRHKMINYETPPPNAVWEAVAEKLDDEKQYAALSARINITEVTPPDAIWTNITSRLDDDKQYSAVTSKLNFFEVTPPISTWDAILSKLDDEKQYIPVATRLNNFEVTPPLSAWDTISNRLNGDDEHDNVSARLQHFTAEPPSQIWSNIATALTETVEEAKPVINIRRNIYRMAAAAVIIGLFIGGWLFVNKNEKIDIVKNNQKIKPPDKKNKETNKTTTVNTSVEQKNEAIALLNQTEQNIKERYNAPAISTIETDNDAILKPAIVNDLLTYQEKPIVIHSNPILDKEGNVIADLDVLTTSNYVIVTGPNGEHTRVSAKLASFIRFMNDDDPTNSGTEEYLEKTLKESAIWKKRFQEWRSKISQSSFIPSAANFLDIVEFKELLQEKQ